MSPDERRTPAVTDEGSPAERASDRLAAATTAVRQRAAAGWRRLRRVPAALLLALPFSLVAGLVVGTLVPAVAAAAAQVVGSGSDAATREAPPAVPAAPPDDAAHPARAGGGATAPVADDDLGEDGPGSGSPGSGSAGSDSTGSDSATAQGQRHRFDPADPGLIYRYPTITGQTVNPPARVTGKIVQSAALPAHSGKGRRVVYSASGQHLWIVDSAGAVVRQYPVTGRVDRPGPGSYSVYSMSSESYNPIAKVSFTHMVRFAHGITGASIGFHAIPRWTNGKPLQTQASLGLALGRGGCIRQTPQNAAFLYDWVHVGDKVVVVA